MSLIVTLNIFSGRPNPVWQLSDKQEAQLKEQLDEVKELTALKSSVVLGRQGYRGFTLSSFTNFAQSSLHIHEGIVDSGQLEINRIASNRSIEEFLLETAAPFLQPNVLEYMQSELVRPIGDLNEFISSAQAGGCPTCYAADAPVYNPRRWNIPAVQPYNNCYNYANDQITNTFAQPGRASGNYPYPMQCANVNAAAQSDGLTNAPNFSGVLAPGQGWYVALVVWPGTDYHWYRQDNNGCWSHKAGGTAATNLDHSGNTISNPQTCDHGPYTDFCNYMITNRGVVIN